MASLTHLQGCLDFWIFWGSDPPKKTAAQVEIILTWVLTIITFCKKSLKTYCQEPVVAQSISNLARAAFAPGIIASHCSSEQHKSWMENPKESKTISIQNGKPQLQNLKQCRRVGDQWIWKAWNGLTQALNKIAVTLKGLDWFKLLKI